MNDNNIENKPQTPIEQEKNEPIINNNLPETPVDEDPNWRIVREQRKAERKAREDAERRANDKAAEAEALKAALEALSNRPQQQSYSNEDETEEQRLNRTVEAIVKKREQEFLQKQREREMQEYPSKLRSNLPEFDKVCHPDNLDYLEYHHPEIAKAFSHMPEGYDKWECIYKATKKYVPNMDSRKEAAKVDKNLAKPGSISSTGTTQGQGIGSPARLSEAQRQANWQRMQKTLKGLS